MNTEANTQGSLPKVEAGATWKLLALDQDERVHQAVTKRLEGVVCAGQTCEVLDAQTLLQAKLLLPTQTDLAVLLVGNLPDQDQAVKELVSFLRDTLKNQWTRVIIACGQDKNPEYEKLAADFSLQGQVEHEALSSPRLLEIVSGAVQSYQEVLSVLAFSNRGPYHRNYFVQDAVAIFKWRNEPGWPVEYASLNVQNLLGYTEAEFVGGQVVYSDLVVEEDLERVTSEVSHHAAAAVTHFEQEYRVRRKDGKVIWVYDYTSKQTNAAGEVTHFIGYVFDITANKTGLSGKESTVLSLQMDLNQRITRISPALGQLLGGEALVLGQPFDFWLGPKEGNSFSNFVSIASISGLPQRFELEYGPEGKKQRGLCFLAPTLDPTHQESGFALLIEDLEAQSAKEEALKLELTKERAFIASASHELRTPLSGILGYAELLKDVRGLDPEQQGFMENIVANSKHLLTLVNDILDLSKIESNQLALNLQEVVFSDLFTSSGVMISSRIEEGVKLVVSAPDLEHYVVCDPVRIKQIFLNLLSNAAKFTKQGMIKLHMASYVPIDENLFSVRIQVEDTGAGIPKERQGELFQPFKQVHSESVGGTGLGLYLSRQIARLMDGDITLSSEPGKGTVFTIELVLTKGRIKGDQFAFNGRRVLVLGDYPTLSEQQKEKLLLTGAEIRFIDCVDPKYNDRIRDILAFDRVDVAVLDLDVLKTKSIYYAGAIRETYPGASLIGLKQKSNKIFCDILDQHLFKPFSYYQLACALDEEIKRFKPLFRVDYSELKVLIAEDVETNRLLFAQMFQRFFNMVPKFVTNGQEALEVMGQETFDLVFMDVEMPLLNGIEATIEIRKFDRTTPIIALTGNVFAEDIQETKEAGMTGFLSKPIQKEELEKVLLSMFVEPSLGKEKNGAKPGNGQSKTQAASPAPVPPLAEEPEQSKLEVMRKTIQSELAMVSDDAATVADIVETAIQEIEETYLEAKKRYAALDYAGLGQSLHKLKGILLNMHIEPYGSMVRELETLVKTPEADRTQTNLQVEQFLFAFAELQAGA